MTKDAPQWHLRLQEHVLAPSVDWFANTGGWQFLLVRQGRAVWVGEAAFLDLVPGDLVVLSPLSHGFMRTGRSAAVQVQQFRFCPDFLTGVLTPAEHQLLEKAALKPRLVPIKFGGSHAASQHMAEACARVGADVIDGLEQRASLLRVVALCFEWKPRRQVAKGRLFLSASKRMAVLMGEITETELCEFSAQELAGRCRCSVPHFKRLFLNHYGHSFQTRQRELRLLKARELLASSNVPIAEVASLSRCPNPRQFVSQFKKMFGLTPGEFREQSS